MNHPLTGSLSTARSERGLGFVDYVEEGHSVPFWCRRGAGAVVAYIYRPVAIEWQQKYAWALERKEEITRLVIEHFRAKFPPSKVEWDTEAIVALKRVDEPSPNTTLEPTATARSDSTKP
jgi:hypothetical protein